MVYDPVHSVQSLNQHQNVVVQPQACCHLHKLSKYAVVNEGSYVQSAGQVPGNQQALEFVQFFKDVKELHVRCERESLVDLF